MKTFPVLWQGSSKYHETLRSLGCPKEVPWDFIEVRRTACLRNHDQTPERLAERGGLAPQELVALEASTRAESRRLWSLPHEAAVTQLLELLSKHANLSKCSGTESGYHVVVHGARACRICGEIVYPDARDIEIARLRSENDALREERDKIKFALETFEEKSWNRLDDLTKRLWARGRELDEVRAELVKIKNGAVNNG